MMLCLPVTLLSAHLSVCQSDRPSTSRPNFTAFRGFFSGSLFKNMVQFCFAFFFFFFSCLSSSLAPCRYLMISISFFEYNLLLHLPISFSLSLFSNSLVCFLFNFRFLCLYLITSANHSLATKNLGNYGVKMGNLTFL